MSTPPITLLAGPTASGKSRLALRMAQESGGVLVNADSQQLYADLRVLSARPSVEDEARVDHRLYGVADGAEAWSVGRWSRAIRPMLDTFAAEERAVIIVGGTGLYFNALTKGLADIPDIPSDVRRTAEADFLAKGETRFRLDLARLDPLAEAAIEAGDRQRLTRAWSVATHTGRSLSDWRADTRPLLAPGSWRGVLLTPERERLYARCDARVDEMLIEGALDEVRALRVRDLDPALPVMKALGVPEFGAVLSGDLTLEEATAALKQNTRRYAKRQMTWFRGQMRGWEPPPAKLAST